MAVNVSGGDSLKYIAELDNDSFKKKATEMEASINSAANAGVKGAKRQDEAIKVQISSIERLKLQMASYQRIADKATTTTRLELYNRKVAALKSEIERMSNAGKAGFDKMGNAIAKTQNPISKALAGLFRMAYLLPGIGVAGLLAFAIDPISDYIKSLDLLGSKVKETSAKRFESPEFQEASKNAIELTSNIEAAKNGYISKDRVLKQYNETIGKTTGQLKSFDQVEQFQKSGLKDYLKMMEMKADAQAFLAVATEKATESARRQAVGATIMDYAGAAAKQVSSGNYSWSGLKADANFFALQDAEKSKKAGNEALKEYRKKIDAAQAFAASKKFNIFSDTKAGTIDNHAKEAAQAAARLQQKVSDLHAEFSRKALTRDEAELQAVRDKFTKIADEVRKFNENPKNKIKVTTDGLNVVRDAAIEDLTFRQGTEKLKLKLDIGKKLYQDFEQYRNDFGEKKAAERFGKELDVSKTYLQTLQEEYKKTHEKGNKEGTTGAVKDRLIELQRQIDEEIRADQAKNDKLLLQYLTYEDERKNIAERSLKLAAEFRAKGKDAEADLVIKEGQKQITAIDETNFKELASYKLLFDGVIELSRTKTKEIIAELEKELAARIAAGTITVEAAQKVQAEINKAKTGVDAGFSEDLFSAAAALGQIASEISGIDDNFGNLLSTVSRVVGAFGEIQKQKAAYEKDGASKFDKVIAGAGMVGAAIGVVASVFNYFKGLKQAAKEARADIAKFYDAAASGEREYQAMLRERARKKAADHAVSLAQIKAEQALLTGQGGDISRQAAALLAKLQQEQYVSSTTYKSGGLFRKASTKQNMSSLAGKSFDDIEQLALQGKLTEGAKKLYDELVKLKAEGMDVEEALLDAGKAAAELATGTNIDSLSQRIIQNLRDGKNGLTDVMSDYKDIIQDSLLSTFESEVVKKQLAAFYAKLSAAAESDGLITVAEKEALAKEYADMRARIQKEAEAYTAVTGTSFADPTKGAVKSELAGAIQGITEQTGELVAGNLGGLRLTAIAQLNIATQSLDRLAKIDSNTYRLYEAIPLLKDIKTAAEKNTGGVLAANGKGG